MADAGRCDRPLCSGRAATAQGFPRSRHPRSCAVAAPCSPSSRPGRRARRKMPQRLRFRGVLRGSPPGTHERMEVGRAEGCVEHRLGVPAIAPRAARPHGSACVPAPGVAGQRYWGDAGFRTTFLLVFEGSVALGPIIKASVLVHTPQEPGGGYARYPDSGISYFSTSGFVILMLVQHSPFRVVSY